jgi:chloride channel 2
MLPGEAQPLKYHGPQQFSMPKTKPKGLNLGHNPKIKHAGWHDLDVFASYRAPQKGIKRSEVEDSYFDDEDAPKLPLRRAHVGMALRRFWRIVSVPILLALIGVSIACVASAVNMLAAKIDDVYRTPIVALYPTARGWLWYELFALALALLSFFVSQALCQDSTGGGIPDVKTVLSGTVKPTTLSFRMLLAKGLGLPIALAAGLSVGREGPFVHMACCLADCLMRLPCFESIRLNPSRRIEVLSCAVAAGVASTFGTPFGGVLFSIETTSMAFMVRNLPQAFFCAMCAATLLAVCGLGDYMTLFSETVSKTKSYASWDFWLFSLLGVVCGLLGVLFVHVIQVITAARNHLVEKVGVAGRRGRQILMVVIATLVVSPFVYVDLSAGWHGDLSTMKTCLFNPGKVGLSTDLFLYVPYKFLATCLCVSLPLPVGLFTPTFITGGAIGRVFGELLHAYLPSHTAFEPWEFAVIGSAAYSAGVTRAVSTAVILFELSGENHIRLPVGVAILASVFVSNWFNENVYDVLINTNKTPHLPPLPPSEFFRRASDIMMPVENLPLLTLSSTYAEGRQLMRDHNMHVIPVVQALDSMALVGSVYREDLERVLDIAEAERADEDPSDADRRQLQFIVYESGSIPKLVQAYRPGSRSTPANDRSLVNDSMALNASPLEVCICI